MDNLKLVIPQIEDLWFKKEIKEDPNTMDYNTIRFTFQVISQI